MQAAYRISIKDKGNGKKNEEEYWMLNEAAYDQILKHVDKHDEEERESSHRPWSRGSLENQ